MLGNGQGKKVQGWLVVSQGCSIRPPALIFPVCNPQGEESIGLCPSAHAKGRCIWGRWAEANFSAETNKTCLSSMLKCLQLQGSWFTFCYQWQIYLWGKGQKPTSGQEPDLSQHPRCLQIWGCRFPCLTSTIFLQDHQKMLSVFKENVQRSFSPSCKNFADQNYLAEIYHRIWESLYYCHLSCVHLISH